MAAPAAMSSYGSGASCGTSSVPLVAARNVTVPSSSVTSPSESSTDPWVDAQWYGPSANVKVDWPITIGTPAGTSGTVVSVPVLVVDVADAGAGSAADATAATTGTSPAPAAAAMARARRRRVGWVGFRLICSPRDVFG